MLEGFAIFDDSNHGQLFGNGEPPRLTNLPPSVVWARAGSEDSDWHGRTFRPAKMSLGDILDNRQGRFFLRVYDDKQTRQLDGCDFRYLAKLKDIRINDEPYTSTTILTPSASGHTPAHVRFVGTDGTMLVPSEATHARQERDHLVVTPHPDQDEVWCRFSLESGTVDVIIHLPWIWWRMEPKGRKVGPWCDKHLTMTRQAFRERATMSIRLSLPRWLDFVHVGFDDDVDRRYPSRRKSSAFNSVVIPLADFIDYPQIDQDLGKDVFLNASCYQTSVPLVRVDRDPVPTGTSATTIAVNDPTTVGHEWKWPVVAKVRCADGGWRNGRGFSLGELRDAGLTLVDATGRSLRVDRRRRTTHPVNVDGIQEPSDV